MDGTLVVNVGAVGRPANDGARDTWYAVVDLDDGEARAELVPVAYDWRAQAASMRAAGLPEAFVETIESGWWTTCLEVVPPAGALARALPRLPRGAASGFAAERSRLGRAPVQKDDGLPVVLDVRHRAVPAAAVDLLELPLQPGV